MWAAKKKKKVNSFPASAVCGAMHVGTDRCENPGLLCGIAYDCRSYSMQCMVHHLQHGLKSMSIASEYLSLLPSCLPLYDSAYARHHTWAAHSARHANAQCWSLLGQHASTVVHPTWKTALYMHARAARPGRYRGRRTERVAGL